MNWKECPRCGDINASNGRWCDCGLDFATLKRPRQFSAPVMVWLVIGGAISMIGVVLLVLDPLTSALLLGWGAWHISHAADAERIRVA